jgi:transcription elongation factor GreA
MQLNPNHVLGAPYRLTKSGMHGLRQRLENLRRLRADHVERLRLLRAQQSGSQSLEDSSLIQTISTIRFLDSEIDDADHVLANAAIVATPRRTSGLVAIGSRVRLESEGRKLEYTIVDSIEADPSSGKISDESPLGQLLLGKKPDDFVKLTRPAASKVLTFKVLSTT